MDKETDEQMDRWEGKWGELFLGFFFFGGGGGLQEGSSEVMDFIHRTETLLTLPRLCPPLSIR